MLASNIDRIAVTITSGTSLSPAVPIGVKTLVGISMPAGWDAAALTFQASIDDAAFQNVFTQAGAEVSATVLANQFIQIESEFWRGITNLKLRSGTSGVPVNQTADRVITLILRSNIT